MVGIWQKPPPGGLFRTILPVFLTRLFLPTLVNYNIPINALS